MGKSQRTKGAVFEREICEKFSSALGREVKRNIGQARDGGNDIDVGPLVVECKRRKTLGTVYGWLQQAIAAIPAAPPIDDGNIQRVPIVVARQDGDVEPIVILRFNDFLAMVRESL